MPLNPGILIELSSYPDVTYRDAYNPLSQKKAEFTVRDVVSNGISRNRIVAKGYG